MASTRTRYFRGGTTSWGAFHTEQGPAANIWAAMRARKVFVMGWDAIGDPHSLPGRGHRAPDSRVRALPAQIVPWLPVDPVRRLALYAPGLEGLACPSGTHQQAGGGRVCRVCCGRFIS